MEFLKLIGDNLKTITCPRLEEAEQLTQTGIAMIGKLQEEIDAIEGLKTHLLVIINSMNKHALVNGKDVPVNTMKRLINVIHEIEKFLAAPPPGNGKDGGNGTQNTLI